MYIHAPARLFPRYRNYTHDKLYKLIIAYTDGKYDELRLMDELLAFQTRPAKLILSRPDRPTTSNRIYLPLKFLYEHPSRLIQTQLVCHYLVRYLTRRILYTKTISQRDAAQVYVPRKSNKHNSVLELHLPGIFRSSISR